MGRVFGKRTLRELGAHILRYLALALMISLSIYLIVSLIGAADTIIIGGGEHAEANRIEDGQFTVFVPLTADEEGRLRERGIDLEAMFYRDCALTDGSVLRVFRLRKELDLAEAEAGAYPAGGEEIPDPGDGAEHDHAGGAGAAEKGRDGHCGVHRKLRDGAVQELYP